MDSLQQLVKLAKLIDHKPVINVGLVGQLGVYTDDSSSTEWSNLPTREKGVRQAQLLSALRCKNSYWLGAYIGHLDYADTSTKCGR